MSPQRQDTQVALKVKADVKIALWQSPTLQILLVPYAILINTPSIASCSLSDMSKDKWTVWAINGMRV